MATNALLTLLFTAFSHAASFAITGEGEHIEVVEMAAPAPSPLPPAEPYLVAPPEALVLSSTLTVADLAKSYTLTFRDEEKAAILERIALTKPASAADATWLLNLFNRNAPSARRAAEASLRRLGPRDRPFEPFFLRLLGDPDPFLQMFGLIGALQLRSEAARPRIREIAERKFEFAQPQLNMSPREANVWQVQFQALRALGEWGDEDARKLMRRRVKEAPPVAALLARYYWKESLPEFVKWLESRRRRAWGRMAFKAQVPLEDLRATRGALEAIARDKKRKQETRRLAAIQLGFALSDDEVDALLRARSEEKNAETKLMLTAAIFASRSPRAVPLLIEFAKTHESAAKRAGALYQLGEQMPRAEFDALLKWVVDNDPDEENRRVALRRLTNPE